jgi:hypothetical protein
MDKIVSSEFDATEVACLQIFTIRFPRISISHNTVSGLRDTSHYFVSHTDLQERRC